MDLPRSPLQHRRERESRGKFSARIDSESFIYRDEPVSDYGADGSLEYTPNGVATNYRIYFQLKSTSRPVTHGVLSYAVPVKTIAYLSAQPSIFVVFVRELDVFFWALCSDILAEFSKHAVRDGPKHTRTFAYRFVHTLDAQGQGALRAYAAEGYGSVDAMRRSFMLRAGLTQHALPLPPPISDARLVEAAVSQAVSTLVRDLPRVHPPWSIAQVFFTTGLLQSPEAQPAWWPERPSAEWHDALAICRPFLETYEIDQDLDHAGTLRKAYRDFAITFFREVHERTKYLSGLSILPAGGFGRPVNDHAACLTYKFFALAMADALAARSRIANAPVPTAETTYKFDRRRGAVLARMMTARGPYVPGMTHLPREVNRYVYFIWPDSWWRRGSRFDPEIGRTTDNSIAAMCISAHEQLRSWLAMSRDCSTFLELYLSADLAHMVAVDRLRWVQATIRAIPGR